MTPITTLAAALCGLAPTQDAVDILVVERHLTLYDVTDLAPPIEDHEALEACLRDADLEPELVGEVLEFVRSRRAGEHMVSLVREWVDLGEGAAIELSGGTTLVANLSAEEHASLRAFLEAQRRAAPYYQLDLRLLSIDGELAEELELPKGEGEILEEQHATLVDALLDGPPSGLETITAPRLAVFPRQRASMSVINQQAYIEDYVLKQDPEKGEITADPVVGVLEEGVVVETRAVPLPDGSVGLPLHVSFSELERPIESFETTLVPDAAPVTIQLPVLGATKVDTKLAVQPGERFVLRVPGVRGESTERLLLWGRVVPLEQLETEPEQERIPR